MKLSFVVFIIVFWPMVMPSMIDSPQRLQILCQLSRLWLRQVFSVSAEYDFSGISSQQNVGKSELGYFAMEDSASQFRGDFAEFTGSTDDINRIYRLVLFGRQNNRFHISGRAQRRHNNGSALGIISQTQWTSLWFWRRFSGASLNRDVQAASHISVFIFGCSASFKT